MEIDISECIFTSENQKISPAAGTIVNKFPNSLNVTYFDCQAGMGYVSLFDPFFYDSLTVEFYDSLTVE